MEGAEPARHVRDAIGFLVGQILRFTQIVYEVVQVVLKVDVREERLLGFADETDGLVDREAVVDLAGVSVVLRLPRQPLVDYTIDDNDGSMVIHNDTADLYRYPDLTAQVEALCGWFEAAVRTELVEELHTLRAIDDAKEAMRAIVELPDERENLFIRFCMQNFAAGRGYTLSKATRDRLFSELTDAEVLALEGAVSTAFEAA